VLVNREKQLRNFCFRVDFKFFLDVLLLAAQADVARNAVFNHVWLGGNRQFEVEYYLVCVFFLFFQLRVHIKKKFFIWEIFTRSFSM